MKKKTYRDTMFACYQSFVTQAIINNLAPLLFVIFQEQFDISLRMISWLIFINFGTQLLVDGLCIRFADRIGYRPLIVASHALSTLGLIFLSILPGIFGYAGLIAAVVTYAIGSGIIEVLASPIADSLPGDANTASMSLLHSFYCWGHVAVVLLTTPILFIIGTDAWAIVPVLWAIVPAINVYNFLKVPLITHSQSERMPLRRLLSDKFFLLAIVMMICAGASEQAMSQWASLFAEKGLRVTKIVGDLLGPCLFAILMGAGRVLFGFIGDKIKLSRALCICAALCIGCYLVTSLVASPFIALIGCAATGFAVSLMWPGMLSLSARRFAGGGTAMFSLLALGGDIGCTVGPWVAGIISETAQKSQRIISLGLDMGLDALQTGLKSGLLAAVLFPALLLVGLYMMMRPSGPTSK